MSDTFDHLGDALEDYFDQIENGEFDSDYYSNNTHYKRTITCKYCNRSGLSWTTYDNRWVLQNSENEFHICREDEIIKRKNNKPSSDLKFIPKPMNLSIDPTNRPESFKDDQLFFNSMKDFFTNNGYFTDRHIQISRRKLRTEYLEHLLVIANS